MNINMDTKTSFEEQVRVDPLSNDSGIGYSRLTPCKLNTLTKSFSWDVWTKIWNKYGCKYECKVGYWVPRRSWPAFKELKPGIRGLLIILAAPMWKTPRT